MGKRDPVCHLSPSFFNQLFSFTDTFAYNSSLLGLCNALIGTHKHSLACLNDSPF